ncbi:patatin-like phospholipase family protein [Pedobacter aquatilis]|uniref:patatin-like phospholipase family protein n=1 Tax=Pedobacter aquatilis TaxID=351343 RepID=UPI0025B4DAB6|nr:patatin-like phospholipase family protein [Pedobacter aquatilis]MDN3588602.1 patatin-like phospholipase family protein [Pedobacter aquatilis]
MSYKILSLDGGGSWALIQARVLQDIYGDLNGHELLKKFDMVIANSGGSLVLATLCNDMKLSEIISVFEDEDKRKQVFSKLSFWEKLKWRNIASLTNVLGPKYSMERKLSGLQNVLQAYNKLMLEGKTTQPTLNINLNELPKIIGKPELQILIIGFDYFRQRATFFRSNVASKTDAFSGGKYYQVSLGHAIHASSNAPVNYFDAPAEIRINQLNGQDVRNTKMWDGGVSGFNNPVLAGLVEALTNNNIPLSDYKILSLGTATGGQAMISDYQTSSNPEIQNIFQKNRKNKLAFTDYNLTFVSDIKKMSTSILGDPPDSATFIAYSILDPSLSNTACLVRINPCIKPILNTSTQIFEAPDVYKMQANGTENFAKIMDLDMDAVANEDVDLIKQLCANFITGNGGATLANQLIRGDGNGKHLGDDTYVKAKNRWLNCNPI